MFSYVATKWNPRSDAEAAAAALVNETMRADPREWRVVFRRPGFSVYCAGIRHGSSEFHLLPSEAGVLLGTVFTRAASSDASFRKATFGHSEASSILQTKGRCLAENFWGRYVAFLAPEDPSAIMIMRSPCGEMDCFRTSIDGVTIYFSDARHCPLMSLRRFSINWNYLTAELATLVPDTRETGLAEVERVLRGECLVDHGSHIQRLCHWHPFRFVRDEYDADAAVAAVELRRVARGCIESWASCYDSIIAMLSGGLDSSILVGLLSRAPTQPRVTCLNYYNPFDKISDERTLARTVAQRAGYPLLEHRQSADVSLESILSMPKAVFPCSNVFGLGDIQWLAATAREHGAQAWFRGHGGDEIFFKDGHRYACADFVYGHGLRPKVLSVAFDAARVTRRALWPTLREGMRDGFRRGGLAPILKEYESLLFTLLDPEALEGVRRRRLFVPSWFDDGDDIPSGKCLQIISLSNTDVMHNPYAPDDDPELVNPLMSQPLQELCLRIPTHVLAHGCRSRGLARLAFEQDLPREVATRQAKGGVLDYVKAIWNTNRSFVADLLLDGVLVNEHIVDKTKLERTLNNSFEENVRNYPRVASLACAEAWARSWLETTKQAPI